MGFISGGYFLVQAKPSAEWRRQKPLLPEKFWIVDGHLCHLYPDLWGWWWTGVSDEEKADVKQRLGLDQAGCAAMQGVVEGLFEAGRIGFGGVFFDVTTASEFHRRYTEAVPDLKLLSVALAENEVERLLAHQPPDPERNEGEPGIRAMVRRRLSPETPALVRGYEVLGYDYGAFNSFAVNYLENEFTGRLGLCLNAHGLLDDYGSARKAADYSALPTTGSEPGLWLAWRVDEHSLR